MSVERKGIGTSLVKHEIAILWAQTPEEETDSVCQVIRLDRNQASEIARNLLLNPGFTPQKRTTVPQLFSEIDPDSRNPHDREIMLRYLSPEEWQNSFYVGGFILQRKHSLTWDDKKEFVARAKNLYEELPDLAPGGEQDSYNQQSKMIEIIGEFATIESLDWLLSKLPGSRKPSIGLICRYTRQYDPKRTIQGLVGYLTHHQKNTNDLLTGVYQMLRTPGVVEEVHQARMFAYSVLRLLALPQDTNERRFLLTSLRQAELHLSLFDKLRHVPGLQKRVFERING